ncbi:hypothetical protein L227DRAFT_617929 [Lentinus tigrinus ALCF2SS1-6]|uniref:Uncharacterized protein n=1 Tax=Lentinus tigrinus ALCF2SS1-6 TaxID=1328759 RepID=A0A5C2RN41_9APHY|nr:hypothetical protein L227DRAFT_617929 [Lentinus tigrinus ALCF2SS1-6]
MAFPVKYTKKDYWDNWLDNIDKTSIWVAHQYMRKGSSDGGGSRIPSINVVKRRGILQDLLPPGPAPELPEGFKYLPPKYQFRLITDAQVDTARW